MIIDNGEQNEQTNFGRKEGYGETILDTARFPLLYTIETIGEFATWINYVHSVNTLDDGLHIAELTTDWASKSFDDDEGDTPYLETGEITEEQVRTVFAKHSKVFITYAEQGYSFDACAPCLYFLASDGDTYGIPNAEGDFTPEETETGEIAECFDRIFTTIVNSE